LDADVISIAKTNENFRLLYDSKGRFTLHHINSDEAKVLAALLTSLLCRKVLIASP
jgi:ribosomal protein S4E